MFLILLAFATFLLSLTLAVVITIERFLQWYNQITLKRYYCEPLHNTIKFDIDIKDRNIFATISREIMII